MHGADAEVDQQVGVGRIASAMSNASRHAAAAAPI